MKHADFHIECVLADRLWLVDLDRGAVSVTNDAEHVVAAVHARFPGRRIFYRDSAGRWDELVHENGVFRGFAPGAEASP